MLDLFQTRIRKSVQDHIDYYLMAKQVGRTLLEDYFSWPGEYTLEFNLAGSPLSGPNSVMVSFDGTTFTISAPCRQRVQKRPCRRPPNLTEPAGKI